MVQQDTLELFVPGRLCLFGEHSDWSGAMRKWAPAACCYRCNLAAGAGSCCACAVPPLAGRPNPRPGATFPCFGR